MVYSLPEPVISFHLKKCVCQTDLVSVTCEVTNAVIFLIEWEKIIFSVLLIRRTGKVQIADSYCLILTVFLLNGSLKIVLRVAVYCFFHS